MVTTISEQEHLALESLIQLFSELLPHKGGVSPAVSHQTPWVPVRERESRARFNGQGINKRTLVSYYWMFRNMQKTLAERVGYSERTLSNYFATNKSRV